MANYRAYFKREPTKGGVMKLMNCLRGVKPLFNLILVVKFITVFSINAVGESTFYEAESAQLGGGAKLATNHQGYSAKGFVDHFYMNDKAEVSFNIKGKKEGLQPITLRYSAGNGDAKVKITVNGKVITTVCSSTRRRWNKWSYHHVDVKLKKGDNEVKVAMATKSASSINLDFVALGKVSHLPIISLTRTELNQRVKLLKQSGVDRLVVIVRNFINCSHNYTYFNEGFSKGGGLYIFSDKGFKCLVDSSQGQILDAELSYDGKKILFSWKKIIK